jgi:hypothetical protein
MSRTPKTEQAPRRRPWWRRWLRRVGITLGVLFLLLALFHRPLFFEGTRYFIVRAAKQQKLELEYKISGSIFTTLHIEGLKGTPSEPGNIQRLEIGGLDLQYSLPGLVREGPHAFLKTLEARDVFVELTPAEKLPPEKEEKPQSIKFPALFPERLVLENVNFTSHGPKGDTVLDQLSFTLYPDAPGALKLNVLDIPGVRRWEGISARTSYAGRNLVLRELVIGPEIALEEFNLDASGLEKKELALHAKGRVFTSQSALSAKVTDLNATNHLDVTVGSTGGLLLADLWAYLNIQPPVNGRVTELDARFTGQPQAPKTWDADLAASLGGAAFKDQALGDVTLQVKTAQGQARVDLKGAWEQPDSYSLVANLPLPEETSGFKDAEITGQAAARLAALSRLGGVLPAGMEGGDLQLSTSYRLAGGRATLANLKFAGNTLAVKGIRLNRVALVVEELSRDLSLPEGAPPFQSLVATIKSAEAGEIHVQGYQTDAVNLALQARDGRITLRNLLVSKGANRVSASGNYTLPADLKSWRPQPGEVDLHISAPELQAFVAPGSGARLAGTLTLKGQARQTAEGKLQGDFVLSGKELVAQGLPIRSLEGNIDLLDDQVQVRELNAVLDDANEVMIGGLVQINAPYAYDGSVDLQLKDLAVLKPLLPAGRELAGAFRLTWSGQGQMGAAPGHRGQAKLDLGNGVYGGLRGLAAQGNVSYTPETISAPDLALSAEGLPQANLALEWRANRLDITQLSLRDGQTRLVEGTLSAPLHLAEFKDVNRLLPGTEPIEVHLKTRQLDLAQILAAAKLDPKTVPASAVLTLDLDAAGTLDAPRADLVLKATEIKATNPPANTLAPAAIDLSAGLQDNRLSVAGEARQALVQPLKITGNLPLDPRRLRETGKLDMDTPIEAAVTMPRTDLGVLEGLAPQVRESRGTVAVDVRAAGTLAQPRLSGSVQGDLALLRFTDPSLPPVDDLALLISFQDDRVSLNRLSGRVAGGRFQAGGRIDLTERANPVFDLRMGARNALVMQNDDLTVRASADIGITGPLKAAAVRGSVFVTRSRFFKDIDILPIGLPGRPAPQPPADPKPVSFPNPPLRDWTFDVAIRTADPFQIQGNMARGQAVADLRLTGTGLAPTLEGNVHVRNLTASLPFSRLEVEDGLINFQRDRPFVPILNVHGHSTIRNHEVQVYLYGPASSPKASFSSDPPLPQAEVVSLLATGTTTSELAGDPNALAGRGAVLVFQKLYRSVFKRGAPTDSLTDNTFLENVQFDIGSTDPATGQSGANLRIPLARNVVLAGGVDVSGNFRGQVKYLVRFR